MQAYNEGRKTSKRKDISEVMVGYHSSAHGNSADENFGGDKTVASAPGLTSAEKLGAAIRDARKGYMLTQQQLAELIGTSDRTLRDIEKGSTSPSVGVVLAAMDALGLTWEIS
ncbi:helix-turn-helix domain-containing protein [Corynebacterium falsenii]|uniref:helix-turn-helix domain-containing protein n=1 Tax=Corynebacterium falsenii TaxID=108486 RepID=UPI00234D23A4|nr:helix-turn-helix domain-containing protein [Corynebacterium falsenii]MDC7104894.1 helix-turn-helix domain-containing protein [Corynebacterium falsenii]